MEPIVYNARLNIARLDEEATDDKGDTIDLNGIAVYCEGDDAAAKAMSDYVRDQMRVGFTPSIIHAREMRLSRSFDLDPTKPVVLRVWRETLPKPVTLAELKDSSGADLPVAPPPKRERRQRGAAAS